MEILRGPVKEGFSKMIYVVDKKTEKGRVSARIRTNSMKLPALRGLDWD